MFRVPSLPPSSYSGRQKIDHQEVVKIILDIPNFVSRVNASCFFSSCKQLKTSLGLFHIIHNTSGSLHSVCYQNSANVIVTC